MPALLYSQILLFLTIEFFCNYLFRSLFSSATDPPVITSKSNIFIIRIRFDTISPAISKFNSILIYTTVPIFLSLPIFWLLPSCLYVRVILFTPIFVFVHNMDSIHFLNISDISVNTNHPASPNIFRIWINKE